MSYRFMLMETPQHALDIIAEMIHMEDSIEAQDAWLKAVIALGYVRVEEPSGPCLCSEYDGDEWECPIHGGEEE